MTSVFLLTAMLASAAAPAPDSRPIYVNGHAWAPFISPMGEPFRAHSKTDDTLADWFRKADRNGDGVLTAEEMVADADRFFTTLDADRNGQIEPEELANYEYEIAPDVQVNSRRRPAPENVSHAKDLTAQETKPRERRREEDRLGEDQLGLGNKLQGAARYGLLDMPEPVAAADTDFNRAITREEFREAAVRRFGLLDTGHTGRLTLTQLEAVRSVALANDRRTKRDRDASDLRIGNGVPRTD
jgi:Ca2+-binding EF-hand superfamily protein